MRISRIALGLFGALAITLVSQVSYAGRCDGNQGNGNGNICSPVSEVETPARETDREYTQRVHTYVHGNSIAIQHLDKRQEATEATVVVHGKRLDSFEREVTNRSEAQGQALQLAQATQAGHGERLDGHDRQLATHSGQIRQTQETVAVQGETLEVHSDTLASHGARIHQQSDRIMSIERQMPNIYGRMSDYEHRLAKVEKRLDKMNDADAIALAVAGHQFNTQGGFQTAISMSTVNGSQAIAIGAGGAINEQVFINVGVAAAGSTSGGVVSSTYSW